MLTDSRTIQNFNMQVTILKDGLWSFAFITVLLLFSDVYSAKQSFGTFSACVKDDSLVLKCFFPFCDNKASFNCSIYEINGNDRTLIGSSKQALLVGNATFLNVSDECQLSIKNEAVPENKTYSYNCTLSRKTAIDVKNLTVTYSSKKRVPENLKTCRSDGMFPLGVSGVLLWFLAILSFQETDM